jgi:glycosyltransferase involved in cell wall biosynthesis
MTKVALIVTVKNEAGAIQRLLDSISAQTRLPDEVVIADGGSTDGTPQLIETWGARQPFPVRVIVAPNTNISQGRNLAIREAHGDLIASTDAGVRLAPQWLEKLREPFNMQILNPRSQIPNVSHTAKQSAIRHSPFAIASGFFIPDAHTIFEMAMSATVLPVLSDIDPRTFMPSSRSVAFTKAAWESVGGYPEWLDYCEDLVFDFALRERFSFGFEPQAIAYFRPRGTWRAFFKQYYLYARGDGKANLFFKRHLIRYATYLVAAPLLIALSLMQSPLWSLALLAGFAVHHRTPYRRLAPYLSSLTLRDKLQAITLVPLIRITGDVAKMLGYPVGVWWRLTRRNDTMT